ncbi:TPA: hypothetical protein N0F65_009475 [Lagenidium giganteum]|uniref:Uncharacterized protein n=1 Tax=Lagenidium giganteum TaxID=4803 RepID=A0AAV2ZE45_9STRA|nr:TPA: hypothetical protein N0F65_009475 [Lagenidium giganteum]
MLFNMNALKTTIFMATALAALPHLQLATAQHVRTQLWDVSVEHDATYRIDGPICSGSGAHPASWKCPKKGDVAVDACHPYLKSYVGDDKCVMPVDAECRVIHTGVWGCGLSGSVVPTPTPTPAPTTITPCPVTPSPTKPTQAPVTPSPTTMAPLTHSPCPPTQAPTLLPTHVPTTQPPTQLPTHAPTQTPTHFPTHAPTHSPCPPTLHPTHRPNTTAPTTSPTQTPTNVPTTTPRPTNGSHVNSTAVPVQEQPSAEPVDDETIHFPSTKPTATPRANQPTDVKLSATAADAKDEGSSGSSGAAVVGVVAAVVVVGCAVTGALVYKKRRAVKQQNDVTSECMP